MNSPAPRIVFLNRSYWPDIEATGQLLTDLCRGLSPQFEVHVICGQPNSPEPGSDYLPVGTEQRDGVTIHRLAHRQFKKKNPFGRILNLLSFYHSARRYLRRSQLCVDVVISETDPFLLPIAGARFADRIDASHCVYLQDIYPDVAEAVGKVRLPFVARLLRGKLQRTYSKASRIVVLGRCMRNRLTNAPWNIDPKIIEIIPNWSDCQQITPIDHNDNDFRQQLGLDDSFVVMHSGNMGLTQRLDVLISAANESGWPDNAKLILVGNGASRDDLLQHRGELDLPPGRVEFVDYQPRHKLAESLSAADVHVISMHENIAGCLCPSKLYGIMAAGRPIIAIADEQTDLCQTVSEKQLGWCVTPGSPSAIAETVCDAVRAIASEPTSTPDNPLTAIRDRSRSIALAEFDRPVVINRFASMLEELVANASTKTSRNLRSGDPQCASNISDSQDLPVKH